jgi:hypothetical protein
VEEIISLLVQGREVGTNHAKGLGTIGGAKAAVDFLFNLGHVNRLFNEAIPHHYMMALIILDKYSLQNPSQKL